MNTKRALLVIAVVALGAIACTGWTFYDYFCSRDARSPRSSCEASGYWPDEDFTHIALRAWKTGHGELYYAIIVGQVDFDPNAPAISYRYSWNTDHGGSLEVNGSGIPYSRSKCLLALDPFGRMQELPLSSDEEKVVASCKAKRVWQEVVMKRLYRQTGESTNGVRSGHWTYSDNNGNLAYEGDYLQGLRDGRWVYYYPSGNIRAELSYRNGKRDGEWRYFDEDTHSSSPSRSITWAKDWPIGQSVSQAGIGFQQTIYPDHRTVQSDRL